MMTAISRNTYVMLKFTGIIKLVFKHTLATVMVAGMLTHPREGPHHHQDRMYELLSMKMQPENTVIMLEVQIGHLFKKKKIIHSRIRVGQP